MMKLQHFFFLFTLPIVACGQTSSFDAMFHRLTKGDVPVVMPAEVSAADQVILDAREPEEYEVSHIEGARYVGYDDFEISTLEGIDRDAPIVVYCSVGYRSEKVARDLFNAGFTNVSNLYGGIFHWVNTGNRVVDNKGQTDTVHTYNKRWSKWLEKGVGVYD